MQCPARCRKDLYTSQPFTGIRCIIPCKVKFGMALIRYIGVVYLSGYLMYLITGSD